MRSLLFHIDTPIDPFLSSPLSMRTASSITTTIRSVRRNPWELDKKREREREQTNVRRVLPVIGVPYYSSPLLEYTDYKVDRAGRVKKQTPLSFSFSLFLYMCLSLYTEEAVSYLCSLSLVYVHTYTTISSMKRKGLSHWKG